MSKHVHSVDCFQEGAQICGDRLMTAYACNPTRENREAQAAMPEGWTATAHEDGWIFFKRPDDMRATIAPGEPLGSHGETLHMLMTALSRAAPPSPQPVAECATAEKAGEVPQAAEPWGWAIRGKILRGEEWKLYLASNEDDREACKCIQSLQHEGKPAYEIKPLYATPTEALQPVAGSRTAEKAGDLSPIPRGISSYLNAEGQPQNSYKVVAVPIGPDLPIHRDALTKLCNQLEAMKRTTFLRPGTGQNYSYLVHEDVAAHVEEARAALGRHTPSSEVERRHFEAEMQDLFSPPISLDRPDGSEYADTKTRDIWLGWCLRAYAPRPTAADAGDLSPYGYMFWDGDDPKGKDEEFFVLGAEDPAATQGQKGDHRGHFWKSIPLYTRSTAAEDAGGLSCADPNRDDCPRHCQDYCNKAEEAKATDEQHRFLQAWYGAPTYDGVWPEHFGHAFTGWQAARRTAVMAGDLPADDALLPAVIALDAAIHKVLIAGGDYGDELSDDGLRDTLKKAQHIAYRALISIGIEKLPGAVNPLRVFLPKGEVIPAAAPRRAAMGAGSLSDKGAGELLQFITSHRDSAMSMENFLNQVKTKLAVLQRPTTSGAGDLSDAERLDWLDEVNRKANERNQSTYGWKFDINHNRAALTDHHYPPHTIREAIDAAIKGGAA